MLKCISAAEVADPTKIPAGFPRKPYERSGCYDVAYHGMLWTENSNEQPKTRDQQKHDLEIPQNRLVWSGSRLMITQNGWIFSICEIYWENGTAGHFVF